MDTKLLNKYLAGDALPEEKREVVRWMKESEEHREQLMQMRHIYDATIWNGNLQEKKAENKKIMMRYLWTSMKIAAVIAMIAFIIHKEYQEYRFEHSTEMQMMTVPAGQRASLVLADGTIVWLNSNSTLKYPATGFHAKERKVIWKERGILKWLITRNILLLLRPRNMISEYWELLSMSRHILTPVYLKLL